MSDIEIRWFKYIRSNTPVLQFRERQGIVGENILSPWGNWKDVPREFEKGGISQDG